MTAIQFLYALHSFGVGKHKKVSRWSSYSLDRTDRSPSLERTFNYRLSLRQPVLGSLQTGIRIIHENARLKPSSVLSEVRKEKRERRARDLLFLI